MNETGSFTHQASRFTASQAESGGPTFPWGIHDGPDLPHQGFRSFLWLMKGFRPRYLIHGHKHVYDSREPTVTVYRETQVINTYGFKVLDIEVRRNRRA